MTPFLFFIHIPKTAGSSFLSILDRLYRDRMLGVYSSIHQETPFTSEQLEEFVHDFGESYSCLASHRLSLVYPDRVAGRQSLGIAFVRDPFELFTSHYFFHRFHSSGFAKARELSLEEYFDYALVQGNYPHYLDWQYHLLTGRGLPEGDRPDMERIAALVAERRLLLFPTKAFDSACVLLSKRHPDLFPSIWYHRRNVSTKDQAITPGLRERFQPYAQKDLQVVALAEKQHRELVTESFPVEGEHEAAIAAFHRYCQRALMLNAPRALTKRVLLKVASWL